MNWRRSRRAGAQWGAVKKTGLALLSLLFALCSFDGDARTVHRSFRGGYPSAVSEARIQSVSATPTITAGQAKVVRDGEYNSKEDVSSYIRQFKGALPRNFITKSEARALGWTGGPLEPFAPGKSIGGDRFGNYEGILPKKKGRVYYECDIDTMGARSRGAKRIVFSNDGLIYYTDDHYEHFTLLYGGEG
jgi:guanyl-specific ribonuclease Sa